MMKPVTIDQQISCEVRLLFQSDLKSYYIEPKTSSLNLKYPLSLVDVPSVEIQTKPADYQKIAGAACRPSKSIQHGTG